jgi:hypothetical protein
VEDGIGGLVCAKAGQGWVCHRSAICFIPLSIGSDRKRRLKPERGPRMKIPRRAILGGERVKKVTGGEVGWDLGF